MSRLTTKIFLSLLFAATKLCAQNKEIDRLIRNELKMTFPSVYFKHKTTDYATMPYSADSCFKYIALHMEDINSMVVWRDSSENEELTKLRIKKLKKGIRQYMRSRRIRIRPVNGAHKITQRTIYNGTDSSQVQYLLSQNAVLDVSAVVVPPPGKKSHVEKPRWWCHWCWGRGAFTKKFNAWRKRNNLT